MLKKAEKPEKVQPAAKRKLTRAERKQIEAIIRQAKGDGKPHTVQDSIPFRNLYPDGLCRLDDRLFSKTIAYEDVNYRLAGPDDQRDIFERLCDFYNGYDPSIGVQMTLSSRHEDKNGNLFGMDAQGDALDDMRVEASGILQMQYERGNNGFVKRKYVTLTIEAENLPAARARFSRIEADTLNRFKVMGAGARVLDGKERLALLHGLLHPEGGQFAFEWDWLPASGLSVKDFISPSFFEFGETRRFRIGEMYGAVSFLQILAPEIQDRILTDFMDVEGNLLVTMHIRGINQNEAIKMVKRKITDLDAMKIPGRYLVFGDRKDLAELKAAELTPLTAVLKEHDAKIREKQRAATADDPAYIISGSAFRMLVGDLFDLLAQYSFLRNRVVEVKTEKRLARLQKNLSGENPSIRRMYRRWGFAEDQVVTCYDILEATLRRAHLTPYDPEEAAEDGIGCGRCCVHCEDHSCEDDYD